MKLINRVLLLIVVSLTFTTTVKAQETMYIYKDGVVVGEHVLAEVDSVIFYKPAHGTVIDNDGNEYKTVVIGTQTWMAENLKTTTYNDGTTLPLVTDGTIWNNLTVGAHSWYNNIESYKDIYGACYNWYAVESSKLCPEGWHVPIYSEWQTLISYVGGTDVAGGKLKEEGLVHWESPNTGAINSSGFTALPSGYSGNELNFLSMGFATGWWSFDESSNSQVKVIYLYNSGEAVAPSDFDKNFSFPVRCIKD